MSMKFIPACSGLMALAALILSASTAASPVITHPTGSAMATRATACAKEGETGCFKGTNVGETVFKDSELKSTLATCSSTVMTGTLTKNNGSQIEADIQTLTLSGTGAAYNSMNECTSTRLGNPTMTTNGTHEAVKIDEGTVASGTPYCLKATNLMAADEFQIRGGTCTEAARKITIIFDTTVAGSAIECKYERAFPIVGTFQTDAESGKDAVFSVAPGAASEFIHEANNSILCQPAVTLQMSLTLETDSSPAEPIYIS
jgi:hypothetical protein